MEEPLLSLTVNGLAREVRAAGDTSLLEVLRNDLGLTGTKYGCGEGACGACVVLVDGAAKRACVTPASEVVGKTITTIEGLAQGDRLHPLQEAFLDEGAMQCGYCVPGMIMSAAGLLGKNPNPSEPQILEAMEGNVCRCCGYPRMLKAIHRAARAMEARK
ncbi:MAG TPA: (2Fe-2S)-binding protein [Fimbriimonas sp.]